MSWTQGDTYHPYAYESQAAAGGSAPSGSSAGLALGECASIVVAVAAESGQTLSGAGSLLCYLYDPNVGLWGRAPELDISVTASSIRTQYSPEFVIAGGRFSQSAATSRRIAYVTSSVTVSGGTNCVVYVLGSRKGEL